MPAPFARRFGRAREPRQERDAEPLGDLFGGADAGIERLAEEREPEPEHDAEQKSDQPVPDGPGPDLRGRRRFADRVDRLTLERLQLFELLLALLELPIGRSVFAAVRLEGREPVLDSCERAVDRARVELEAELGELLRVGRDERHGDVAIGMLHGEVDQVGVGSRFGRRRLEELLRREIDPAASTVRAATSSVRARSA